MNRRFVSSLAVAVLALIACGEPQPPQADSLSLPPLAHAVTTRQQTLRPTAAFASPALKGPPTTPKVLERWLEDGLGDFETGPGEGFTTRAPPGETPPAAGPNAKRLVRFIHLSDVQLADDESPTRTLSFDQPGPTSGAFRPQEGLECRVLNAAVRTINALHREAAFDFVLSGGDNADNAQHNEQRWFLDIVAGGREVRCDSGDVTTLEPGLLDDGKDTFISEGLAMPWRWVTGNHDVLVQGNFPVTDDAQAQAVGTVATAGTRDYTKPGGPVTTGPVVADEARRPLKRAELMQLLALDGDGHGLGPAEVALGKATYAFDVPGTSLRFIVLDTANEEGSSIGIIRRADFDGVIKSLFDAARDEGKLVVLASHHSTERLDQGGSAFGTRDPTALTADEWVAFVTSYSNVVFSMVGHSHENRIRFIEGVGGGFWEVMTSALADYPNQVRAVELWDEDNGWLRMHTELVDYATDDDVVAARARRLGIADAVSGWADNGVGTVGDRNADVFILKR